MMKQALFIIVLSLTSSTFASSSPLLEEEKSEHISDELDQDLESQQQDLEDRSAESPFHSLVDFFGETDYQALESTQRGHLYAYAFFIEFSEQIPEQERFWKHLEARSIPQRFTRALDRLMTTKPHLYRELFDKRDGVEIFKQLRGGPPSNATVFAGNITYKNGRLSIDPKPLTKDQMQQIIRDYEDWKCMSCHVALLVIGFCGFIAFIMGYAVYSGT